MELRAISIHYFNGFFSVFLHTFNLRVYMIYTIIHSMLGLSTALYEFMVRTKGGSKTNSKKLHEVKMPYKGQLPELVTRLTLSSFFVPSPLLNGINSTQMANEMQAATTPSQGHTLIACVEFRQQRRILGLNVMYTTAHKALYSNQGPVTSDHLI